jgi:glycine/D-amino acid oxidase-like deaminating enzyme
MSASNYLCAVDRLSQGVFVAVGGNGFGAKASDGIGQLAAGLVTNGRWVDPYLRASDFAVELSS